MPKSYLIRVILWLVLLPGLPWSARGLELNYAPFFTAQRPAEDEPIDRWQALGPIIFEKERDGRNFSGIRPLFLRIEDPDRDRTDRHILYPVFNHRATPDGTRWDLFTLANFSSSAREGEPRASRFHLFPFLFFQNHPDPEREYFGIFPIAGEVQDLLGYDSIRWFTFPFSVRLERGDETTVGMPWPFIRFVDGERTRGFHLWPLYGQVEREEISSHRYFLWPLGFRTRSNLQAEQPFEAHGFIPFYTYSRSETAVSRTYVWPFFGYTTSFSPQYDEVRYFWPLLVQRRGERHYINRWAPVYSHSVRAGIRTRWYLWPLLRKQSWIERDLVHDKSQLLYFLYWSLEQRRPDDPDGPRALKRHVWPLFSEWDDGAGHKQFQLFSPFEVFFPYNEIVRENWSPLFAVYRYDRRPERTRHSILFDFITWTHRKEDARFQVGPLASYERAEEGRRFELLNGLLTVGAHDEDQRSFRFLWLPRERDARNEENDD